MLSVLDLEGVWSYPTIVNVSTNNPKFPPTVDCDPIIRDWSNTDVNVMVNAADPDGDYSYTKYQWSTNPVKPTNGYSSAVYTNRFPLTQNSEGSWYLHLISYDLAGNSFYRVRGPYNIDKTPPSIDSDIHTSLNSDVSINAKIMGEDSLSGIDYMNYTWTKSVTKPILGWKSSIGGLVADTLEDDSGDLYYLHMEAFDKAGNSFYRYRGPFSISGLKILSVNLSGYWNHWRGQNENWGNPNPNTIYPHTLSVEPHRFLSLECVKISVDSTGYADKVEISFSPELQAMQFTDSSGHNYDYYEDFGISHVNFPIILNLNNSSKENHVTYEYYLPLAPSTIGWDNLRKRPQYYMTVKVWKGLKYVTYTMSDIDITGNIYDLTYIQPKI